jgi:arylsulfate sulfotransferase
MRRIAEALVGLLLLTPLPALARKPKLALSPQTSAPLGTKVVLVASVESVGPVWFRFRARPIQGDFDIIRDFGPETVLPWTAAEKEGLYELEVAALERDTGEVSYSSILIEMTPRVTSGEAVITALDHPMVFLYSAGPCAPGSLMSVEFRGPAGRSTTTPAKPCDGITTMNFYLAGLLAGSAYTANHRIRSGGTVELGPVLSFETAEVDISFSPNTVLQNAKAGNAYPVMLHSSISQPSAATDLEGNLIWYYDGEINFITRPEAGGRFLGIRENLRAGPDQQVFRLFDLAGFMLKETNAARVSEQLSARGMRPITGFHHEARQLAGGKFLVLASTEQLMKDVQGEGEIDVLGDTILVFDAQLQLEWAWDAFDHLDVRRKATLGETCEPLGGGCPPFFLAPVANDWLHGNSLQLTPDGNILYSARHQDWLIKINYDHGQGSGAVLWRLGKDGDFQSVSSDASPWFSHQHDGGFADSDGSLTVFDNGNIRAYADPAGRSRGQMWKVNEAARQATLEVNADLGVYSFALGSAHKLPEGGFHFNIGWVPTTVPASARSVEVDASGKALFSLETARAPMYRSFRLKDLYTAPAY